MLRRWRGGRGRLRDGAGAGYRVGIAHYEKRDAFLEAEVLHLDDVRVVKMSDELGPTQEVLLFLRVKKVDLEDFDRVIGVQVDMLTQVDIGEAARVERGV